MSRFTIIKTDPETYKDEICQMWSKYLPGTPQGRLEWMKNNTAGLPDWFLALDSKSKEVAGMISIMPKRFNLQGRSVLAGIVGDLAVKKAYQVFGPTLTLLKTVIREHENLNYDFLYTMPNCLAEKICLRAGFTEIAATARFVKVLRPGRRIMGYLPKAAPEALAPIFDVAYRLVSKDAYIRTGLSTIEIDDASELQSKYFKETHSEVFSKGGQTLDYIAWRYFQCPLNRFRMLAGEKLSDCQIAGTVVYTENDSRLYVYDISAADRAHFKKTLVLFLKTNLKKNYASASVRLIDNTPLSLEFQKLGFVKRNSRIPILFAGNPENIPKEWHFFDGERNI